MKVILASLLAVFVLSACCANRSVIVTPAYYAPAYYPDVVVYDYYPYYNTCYSSCGTIGCCR